LGFYKDVAPTALGNMAIEVKVSTAIFEHGRGGDEHFSIQK
jgi:hypothetical protein